MDDLRGLVLNAAGGFLLFLLGFVSRQLYSRWQAIRLGRFWRRLARGRATAVLGRLDRREFLAYEPSGVAGIGDLRALEELNQILRQARMRPFIVGFTDTLTEEQINGNLTLLGGPDGNSLSAEFMSRVGSRLELVNIGADPVAPPVLVDKITRPPSRYQPTLEAGQVVNDLGVLIRARNPRDPHSWVVIIAGCLGFGTWAGVQLTREPELARAPDEFECVFQAAIDHGTPIRPSLVTGIRILGKMP